MPNVTASLPAEDIAAALIRHATTQPDQPAVILLADGEEESGRLTYAQLLDGALALAHAMRAAGLSGKPVLIPAQTSLETAIGFYGALFADAIAVPISTQLRGAAADRLRAVALSCGATAIIEAPGTDVVIEVLPELRRIAAGADRAEPVYEGGPDTPALLQYTSGSTAVPKGVIISRGNLAANSVMAGRNYELSSESRMFTWLPLFHDMGLMSLMMSVRLGVVCILAPPLTFLQKPQRWAIAISRYGATASGGPNFAFELLAARAPDVIAAGVDLSKWRTAYCGSEPIRLSTLTKFAEAFAPVGLQSRAILPSYGMAEATVFVAGSRWDASRGEYPVSCGWVEPGSSARIVSLDAPHVEVAEGESGEIWLQGAQIGLGYLNMPDETKATFGGMLGDEGPFLRTGDIGTIRNGELYVLGRHKDLVIHRGTNIHPVDVEASVAHSDPAFENGAGALFAIDGGADSADPVILVQEINRHHLRSIDPVALRRRIADIAAIDHGLRLKEIVLVKPGSLPRTASGKVQRAESRRLYLAGALDERRVAEPAKSEDAKVNA